MRITIYIALALLFLSNFACSSRPTQVVFNIPKGFRGLFLLSEDKASGASLHPKDDEFTIEVPNNGRIVVSNLAPLSDWHKERALFKDGAMVTIDIPPANDNGIGVYSLAFVANRGAYYFVGNRSDYLAVSKLVDYGTLPLGRVIEGLVP
jgi:hypothetical protein